MEQTNLEDSYYFKLYYLLKTGYLTEKMHYYHISDLSIDLENYIYQFDQLWFLKRLNLLVIREIYDQIVSDYSDQYKRISFLVRNYY